MEQWKKYQIPILVVAIVFVGFFLRFYNYSDWLHFELDQARDARVVDRALSGDVFDLPLLGPKAGGTFLRLGPGFYWLEYVGAIFFGGAVVGGVVVIALASVSSIIVFFILAKRFFATRLTLCLTFLFAVSAYMVLYGRFAWNPNFIPFFTLLGFYALLRVVDKEERHPGRFLVLTTFAIGMATHMHFLAFLALPAIVFLFLIFRRPVIALKFWTMALGVFFLLYAPMVLNEVATGGQNAQEFIAALSEKSTREDHPLIEKLFRNVSEFGLHSLVILTGFEGGAFPAVVAKDGIFGSVCDTKCDQGKWYGILSVFVLGMSVVALFFLWLREKEQRKRDVLLLSLLWFGVTFLLFLPLSYGIAPRFFLLNAPLFFLLLGFLLEAGRRLIFPHAKRGEFIGYGIILVLIVLNISFLSSRFNELDRAHIDAVESAPDRILKERVRVTLSQQNQIVEFLADRSEERDVPIYMFSEPQHRRALKYLLEKRGVLNDVLGFSKIYREGRYFLIIRTQSDREDALEKYLDSYTLTETTPFGTLVVLELTPKEEAIVAERQVFSLPEKQAHSQAPPRYTLREFFQRQKAGTTDEEEVFDKE